MAPRPRQHGDRVQIHCLEHVCIGGPQLRQPLEQLGEQPRHRPQAGRGNLGASGRRACCARRARRLRASMGQSSSAVSCISSTSTPPAPATRPMPKGSWRESPAISSRPPRTISCTSTPSSRAAGACRRAAVMIRQRPPRRGGVGEPDTHATDLGLVREIGDSILSTTGYPISAAARTAAAASRASGSRVIAMPCAARKLFDSRSVKGVPVDSRSRQPKPAPAFAVPPMA